MQPDSSGTRCTIICCECDKPFPAQRHSKKRCDECQAARRKAMVRQNVTAYRDTTDCSETMKEIPLICGHTILLRIMPVEGEYLPCTRCGPDQWREYTNGIRRELCAAQIHRMTPFNTVTDPATNRRTCRRCLEATLGHSVLPGVTPPSKKKKRNDRPATQVRHPEKMEALDRSRHAASI